MNGGGFARIDEEGVPCRGGLVSVTFSTPPEKGANGVHVLGYVTRTPGPDRVEPFTDPGAYDDPLRVVLCS